MTRDEYIEWCQGLIDSFDERVTVEDIVFTLRDQADIIERIGEFEPAEREQER